MAEANLGYAHRGEVEHLIPKASTEITAGDYVVMPRESDPISRAVLGAETRVSPVGSAYACQWGVGVSDDDFNTNYPGATPYASPAANQSIDIIRKGVVRFRIIQTSGKAGDNVVYSSGGTGAQLFKINNFRRDVGVGEIAKDFSGATANDTQQVVLYEKSLHGQDIYFWLQNRVVQGCKFKARSLASSRGSSQINAGATGEVNMFMVKGKVNSVARVTGFVVGGINPGGQSAIRFYWLACKLSTTGAAPAFTKETCTGPFSAFASWTNSGISVGMMIPITWQSNLIPAALMVGWSNTQVTIADAKLINLGGPFIPNGQKLFDHGTWYL